jgi:hypothetical protein
MPSRYDPQIKGGPWEQAFLIDFRVVFMVKPSTLIISYVFSIVYKLKYVITNLVDMQHGVANLNGWDPSHHASCGGFN